MLDLLTPFLPWILGLLAAVAALLGFGQMKKKQGQQQEQVKTSEEAARQAMLEAEKQVAAQRAASDREVETVKNANDVATDVSSRPGSAADRLQKSRWNRDTKKPDGDS